MVMQRFWLAAFLVLIALALTDFVLHGFLLVDLYRSFGTLARETYNIPVMILSYAVLAPLFTWMYVRGYGGGSPVGEGIRFGLVIGLFYWVGAAVMRYAVQPFPGEVALSWLFLGTAQMVLLGMVAGLAYGRPEGGGPGARQGGEAALDVDEAA